MPRWALLAVEALTTGGLLRYFVLFVIDISSNLGNLERQGVEAEASVSAINENFCSIDPGLGRKLP